ncbi:NAD(P)-dependent alcohol dehydrogenase [Nocardia sp. CDC160]|uniref:NAD(P)-dependent alcohol dehydrogenase n=1 Tax=Nocardia sp. CDC160 TaxID=3112166 RepID=UPI002DBF39E2|nr:NAD(P)-dependent alcohol dehydrogenase [Nocardia sp. CDC160]MEC3918545.1 NAD(P)-dependent alcohol dehydrogenase [Nocardia sp. CDC160]
MKAIAQEVYGGTDVLSYTDIPMPEVGQDGVLIRVRAAGVDPSVWHFMTGEPLVARLALGLRRPRERVRGWDVSGIVEEVGPRVREFRPGDEVFGTVPGSFAEFACAPALKLAHKPERLSFEQAAALPISGMTALNGLRDSGHIEAGQHVLIIGAAGGVGHLAVQLAKHYGAEVTGVCSGDSAEFVRDLGADRTIDYTTEKLTGRYDLILDMAGNRPLPLLRSLLTDSGTLVLGGGEGGGRFFGGLGRSVRAQLLSPFTRQRLRSLLSLPKPETLRTLAELATAGALTPRITRTYTLPEAAVAIENLGSGHACGKSVLVVG